MCEAEIRKLEDIMTALLALKNKYSSRQTLAFLSQTERLRRDDGGLLRSSASARLRFDEEITHDALCFNSNVDSFVFSAASDKGEGQQDGCVCSTVTSRDVLQLQNRQHSPSSIMFPGNYNLHNTKVTSNQRQRSETQIPPPEGFFFVF